ncbi:MAG: Lrp/AsnC family transcriptional regulator, partial [Pseudomonadota bacterium]
IRARVALLDAARLGLPLTVFISIKTNEHNAEWAERFQAVVERLPGVLEVHRLAGDVDYLIKAVVADMAGYDSLYQQLIEARMTDVSAAFVMEEIKNTAALPILF